MWIKTREITQISSEISGVRGKIDVEEWHVGIVPLYESHSSHDLNIRARMAVGIRENVSGVVNGTEHTIAAASQLGDNAFAGVNTALAAYGTVRAVTRLVQSGLISAGPMIGVDMSVSGSKMMHVSHAPNMVQFGELETSIAVPDMSVPKDMVSTSSYGLSGGISNSGWNAFASVEGDGTRMGLGYSHAWEGAGVFGDEVRIVAGSGDNVLDATWASMDAQRFGEVWGDASLTSVMARTEAEITRAVNDVRSLRERVEEMLGISSALVEEASAVAEIIKPDLVEEYKAENPTASDGDVAQVANLQKLVDNVDTIAEEIESNSEVSDEQKADSIVTQIFGIPSAEASTGVAVGAEVVTVDAIKTALQYMAAKYGMKVAKFVAMKVLPRGIPGVGTVLLVKDVYDLINDNLLSDDTESDIFEKKKHGKEKAQTARVGGAISVGGMPNPDDFEPDDKDDAREDTKFKWEVKEKQDADKISRHDKFGNFYRDPEQKFGNNRIWWSKDNARHGGAANKIFKETGRGLEHIADVDELGNVIPKHKSPIGQKISWKELSGIK